MGYAEQQNSLTQVANGLPPQVKSQLPESSLVFLIEEISGPFSLTMGQIGWLCELVRQVITKEKKAEDFETGLKEKLADDEDALARVPEIVWEINDKIFTKLLPALGMKALPITPKPLPPVVATVPDEQTNTNKKTAPSDGEGVANVTPTVQPKVETVPVKSGVAFEDEQATPSTSPLPTTNYQLPTSPLTPPRPVPLTKTVPPSPIPKPASSFSSPLTTNNSQLKSNFVTPIRVPPQPLTEFASPSLSSYKPIPSPAPKSSTYQLNNLPTNPSSPISPKLPATDYRLSTPSSSDSFLKMLSGKLSDKELQIRFDKLPYSLKTALRNVDSAKKVVEIGRKYALHVDKLGELAEETGMVILGMTHPSQFLVRLTHRLGMSEEKAKAIAEEINNEIFLKIREALKQVNGEPVTVKPVQPTSNLKEEPLTNSTSALNSLIATVPEKNENLNRESLLKDIEDPLHQLKPDQEQFPDREALLNDIENPTPARFTSVPKFNAPIPTPQPEIARPAVTESRPITETRAEPAPVVPTTQTAFRKTGPADFVQPEIVKTPAVTTFVPRRPDSASEIVAPTPSAIPKNTVDQKLSNTVVSPKSQSNYSSDPYREPLG